MSQNPEEFLSDKDIEWERTFFSLVKDLKTKNSSRYEELALRLSSGGEELLDLPSGIYKISVDKNGCGYSSRMPDGKDFQRLGWTKLPQNLEERISAITDTLAECEARAEIDA